MANPKKSSADEGIPAGLVINTSPTAKVSAVSRESDIEGQLDALKTRELCIQKSPLDAQIPFVSLGYLGGRNEVFGLNQNHIGLYVDPDLAGVEVASEA